MISKMDEMIVVSPRSAVFDDERLAFQGVLPMEDERSGRILQGLTARVRLARRGDVEEDPTLLQPIPYIVVMREGSGEQEVFTYTRLTGGGEQRLHGKVSVGVGGHMNRLFDHLGLMNVVAEEAGRELEEELVFRDSDGREVAPSAPQMIGLINDDSGDVQRVHLGLLARVDVPRDWQVEVRETDGLEGSWRRITELEREEVRGRLEEWTVHALSVL